MDAEELAPVMPWGRHRGTPIDELPTGYLKWLLNKCEFCPERLKPWIRGALMFRDGYTEDEIERSENY